MSRIFLLLNDPLVAGRMRGLIDATPGLQTVGWVATMDQARAQLPALQADLVLSDLQLADGWVAGFVDELSTSVRYGRPKALVVTMSLDDSQLIDALVRGADGYFVQGQSPQSLIAAIEQTLSGGAEMAPGIARQVKAHFDAARLEAQRPPRRREPAAPRPPRAPGAAVDLRRLPAARDRPRPAHQRRARWRCACARCTARCSSIAARRRSRCRWPERAGGSGRRRPRVDEALPRVELLGQLRQVGVLRRASRSAGSGSRGSPAHSRPRCRPATGGCRSTRACRPGPCSSPPAHACTRLIWRSIQAWLRCSALRPAQVASRRARMAASSTPSASASQVRTSVRSRPRSGISRLTGEQRVDVLDDHARIEHRLAAFEHQAGHLAQRVGLQDGVGCSRRPRARTGSRASSRPSRCAPCARRGW